MNEDQYISRINQLEKEIGYLHSLLDEAGITYRKEAKNIEDLSPDKNILFDDNQGARVRPLEITKHRIKFFRNLFNGRNDVCGDDWANPDSEWMTEVNTFRKICEDNDVPVLVERSRPGKGAHFWIFFEKPIPASTARRFGTALLAKWYRCKKWLSLYLNITEIKTTNIDCIIML